MDVDEAKRLLEDAGYKTAGPTRLNNDSGHQLRVEGAVVNVFDNGNVQVQGKPVALAAVKAALAIGDTTLSRSPKGRPAPPPASNREVFVVYGHDSDARTQLEAMLRRWDLEPLILDQLPSEGATLIEKLEKYAREDVRFAVVLATPDDEGNVRGKPDEKKLRARQNVVLELGVLLAKLGRPRVAILLKDQEHMERPSDLQGLIYLAFSEDVDEVKVTLAKEMAKQGIEIAVGRL